MVHPHPMAQRFEDRHQAESGFRQSVLDLRRDFRVDRSDHQVIAFELAQLQSQHPLGDRRDGALELPEPRGAFPQAIDDERLPLAADKIERQVNRAPAVHVEVVHFSADDPRVESAIGDFEDALSLRRASTGVDCVYLVMPLVYDRERVVRWGRNAIDAAVEAGVGVIVFNTSSVVSAKTTGVTAIDIKVDLEAYLQQARIPSIVLRTTVYMGNFAAPWSVPALVHQGVLAYPLPADRRVSWISWEEAAAYAVAALKRPDLAALKPVLQTGGPQVLTGPELAAVMQRVLDRPVSYVAVPLEQFEAGLNASFGVPVGTEIARFYAWISDPANGTPLDVDLTPLRVELPALQKTFEAWAREIPWAQLADTNIVP